MRFSRIPLLTIALVVPSSTLLPVASYAQTAAPPHATGTVKSASGDGFELTSATGDVHVSVPAAAKVLVVPPGSHDLKAATVGSVSDIATGDRALVTGTAGDAAGSLTAVRVILMKGSAIATAHASEEAAWADGSGGIVKVVDAAAGTVQIASGRRIVAIATTPKTIVRRYADGSVRFQDATQSTLAAVQVGDQLRVRGTKSDGGTKITADEIVVGTFRNYSGLLTAIDPAAGTVTLKDLTTKRVVTVAVTQASDVRRLPAAEAQTIAAHMRGGASAAHTGEEQHAGGAGRDLSGMLAKLPTESLAGLKVGDAVMIVATAPASGSTPTAVTLLAGVDPILTAPEGSSTTLSPWSMGGGGDDAGGR